jgi:hypothetical protein
VLSEYNLCEQAGSSAEDDFRLAPVVDGDETDRKELFNFSPSNAKKGWMAPTKGEACSSNHDRRESANSLPMDELGHPQERELRALMTASLDGDGAAYHTLLKKLTGHLRAYYRHASHGWAWSTQGNTAGSVDRRPCHRHTYDELQPFRPGSAIARYKFLDYLRRTKSSFKDLPGDASTAKSDMAAVERPGFTASC